MRFDLQIFGGRGGGSSREGGGGSQRSAEDIRDEVNNVGDMISSGLGSRFTDEQRTRGVNTLINNVIENSNAYSNQRGALNNISNWAEGHNNNNRFPKLKSFKNKVRKM